MFFSLAYNSEGILVSSHLLHSKISNMWLVCFFHVISQLIYTLLDIFFFNHYFFLFVFLSAVSIHPLCCGLISFLFLSIYLTQSYILYFLVWMLFTKKRFPLGSLNYGRDKMFQVYTYLLQTIYIYTSFLHLIFLCYHFSLFLSLFHIFPMFHSHFYFLWLSLVYPLFFESTVFFPFAHCTYIIKLYTVFLSTNSSSSMLITQFKCLYLHVLSKLHTLPFAYFILRLSWLIYFSCFCF